MAGWCVAKAASKRMNQAVAFVVQKAGALNDTAFTVDEAVFCADITSANCRRAVTVSDILHFFKINHVGVTTEATPVQN